MPRGWRTEPCRWDGRCPGNVGPGSVAAAGHGGLPGPGDSLTANVAGEGGSAIWLPCCCCRCSGVLLVLIAGLCRGEEGKVEGPGSVLSDSAALCCPSRQGRWSAGRCWPVRCPWPCSGRSLSWGPLAGGGTAAAGLALPAGVQRDRLAANPLFVPFGVPYLRLWVGGLGVPGLVLGCCYRRPAGRARMDSGRPADRAVAGSVWPGRCRSRAGPPRHWFGMGGMAAVDDLDSAGQAKPFPLPTGVVLDGMATAPFLVRFFAGRPGLHVAVPVPGDQGTGANDCNGSGRVDPRGPGGGTGWLALAGVLWVPFLFGLWAGRLGEPETHTGLPATFVLVRPVSTATLVAAKLRLCAGGTALLGGVLIVAIAGWGGRCRHGRWVEMSDRLIALSGSAWAAVLVLVGGLLALFAITWGHLAAGLWVGLTGGDGSSGVRLVGSGVTGFVGSFSHPTGTEPAWRSEAQAPARRHGLGARFKVAADGRGVLGETFGAGCSSPGRCCWRWRPGLAVAAVLFAGLAWLVPAETVSEPTWPRAWRWCCRSPGSAWRRWPWRGTGIDKADPRNGWSSPRSRTRLACWLSGPASARQSALLWGPSQHASRVRLRVLAGWTESLFRESGQVAIGTEGLSHGGVQWALCWETVGPC